MKGKTADITASQFAINFIECSGFYKRYTESFSSVSSTQDSKFTWHHGCQCCEKGPDENSTSCSHLVVSGWRPAFPYFLDNKRCWEPGSDQGTVSNCHKSSYNLIHEKSRSHSINLWNLHITLELCWRQCCVCASQIARRFKKTNMLSTSFDISLNITKTL